MTVRIIHRRDGMYDVYDRATGKWIISRRSPDNILSWLSEKTIVNIDFVDESFPPEISQTIGRWIHKEGEEFSYCSVCNYPVSYMWNMTNYCPNCGVKMGDDST